MVAQGPSVPPPPSVPEAWLPKKLRNRSGLLDSTDVPTRQKVPFILWGYRPQPAGPFDLLRGVFGIHNETGNIWSHLLGVVYCAWAGGKVALAQDQAAVWILLLVVASAYCFSCSFMFHLCSCSGSQLRHCTYRMDLTGIVVLITVSYFAGIALGFRCYPALQSFYLVYASLVSLALAVPLLQPELVKDLTRHMIFCVACGVVPAVHFLSVATSKEIACVLPYLLQMFGFYGLGACFYVSRWPECRWPGYFDIIGHSHQFWHLFVLLAAASWVEGCSAMMLEITSCKAAEIEEATVIA